MRPHRLAVEQLRAAVGEELLRGPWGYPRGARRSAAAGRCARTAAPAGDSRPPAAREGRFDVDAPLPSPGAIGHLLPQGQIGIPRRRLGVHIHVLAAGQGFDPFGLPPQEHRIIGEQAPALPQQPEGEGRFATPGAADDEQAIAVPADHPGGMQAKEAQGTEQLEQAKGPEVALQAHRLGRKGRGEPRLPPSLPHLQVQERGPIGEVKVVAALESPEPLRPKHLPGRRRDATPVVVQVHRQVQRWEAPPGLGAHPRQVVQERSPAPLPSAADRAGPPG